LLELEVEVEVPEWSELRLRKISKTSQNEVPEWSEVRLRKIEMLIG